MTFANVLKILMLVGTVLQVVAGMTGILSAELSAILAGLAAAIFAFVSKIPTPTTPAE